jgi:hypothetical protein
MKHYIVTKVCKGKRTFTALRVKPQLTHEHKPHKPPSEATKVLSATNAKLGWKSQYWRF